MMLSKKEVYTVITPIPAFIPRQLAIDILHSHSEVISLNPLVLDHKPIKAPCNAPSDEYYSTWYQIMERIQYIPGIGRLGSGRISFNGCFHDLPWGLQTHIYAPAGVDLRNKYRIAGNQPGFEPPERQEMGLAALGAPNDGLYLREDIEIRCNFTMMAFVKSQLKAASRKMVDRFIKKAELLDAGVLQGMIEDGKLKTVNPNDRSYYAALGRSRAPSSPPLSPTSISMPYWMPQWYHQSRSGTPASFRQQSPHPRKAHAAAVELPCELVTSTSPMELPGDSFHPSATSSSTPPPPSPPQQQQQQQQQQQREQRVQPQKQQRHSSPHTSSFASQSSTQSSYPSRHTSRTSTQSRLQHHVSGSPASSVNGSPDPNGGSWYKGPHSPTASRPGSVSSEAGSVGFSSPGLEARFTAELATHQETREEHGPRTGSKLDPRYGSLSRA